MNNKFLLLLIAIAPSLTNASADPGLVSKPFTITNATRAMLYYRYATTMTGKVGRGLVFKGHEAKYKGMVKAGETEEVPACAFYIGGVKKDYFGKEISLDLSIDQQRWLAAKVTADSYTVFADPRNALILQIIRARITAPGTYILSDEGRALLEVPLTALPMDKKYEANSDASAISDLNL